MKFRKKPVVIDAAQWFQLDDDPRVVRYSHPWSPNTLCDQCHGLLDHHGWVHTLEGGHRVCPGDWIVTGVAGETYPCKADIFVRTYEPE